MLARFVLDLANDLLDKYYCLYLGNWFANPKVVDILYARRMDVVGTVT
jgi:hypothetical protein